ncbi:hypothetical protein C8Q79DRAFT_273137 [Trametes meyenii]|nr:hypothetical protein C8Q79DRAFT_273137 [Trametes meyenii]
MVAIGDAIVWWRACVLFPGNRIIFALTVLLPVLVLLSGAVPTAILGPNSGAQMWTKPESYAGSCLSLISNFAATGLIGRKTWEHRRMFKAYLSCASPAGGHAQRVMLLLVESGVTYCMLWIIVLAIQTINLVGFAQVQSGSSAYAGFAIFFQGCLPTLVATYPVAIVLLASLRPPLDERATEGATPLPQRISVSIAFAPAPVSLPCSGVLPVSGSASAPSVITATAERRGSPSLAEDAEAKHGN